MEAAPGAAILPAPAAAASLPLSTQVITFVVLLVSIVSSRFLDLYRVGLAETLRLDWQYLLFLAIVTLLAFPVVYDRVLSTRDQPLLLRIATVFTLGLGWEKILATATGR